MSTLYEVSNNMIELAKMDEDEAVINTLDGLEMEFTEKAKNIIFLERNINSDIEAIDKEISRLQELKSIRNNRIKRLKDYLRENMERTGINKIECPLFTITCVKGRDMASIVDETKLPNDCVAIRTIITPNKSTILKKLKSGEDVPGAELTKTKSSIKIK